MSKEESEKQFALGNEAFVDEDYDTAIKCYSEAIKSDKENFDYYLKRSNAYLKQDKFSEALDDANTSIKYKSTNGKAWQRKGLALFSMDNYEEALEAYKEALKVDVQNEQLKKSIRICEAEIDLKNNQKPDSNNIKVGFSSIPTEEKTDTQDTKGATVKKEETKSETNPQPVQLPSQAPKIKHDWYQTETHVIITVMIKNIKQENVAIEFQEKSLSVTATKLPNGNEYSLELDLAHDIKPAESSYKILSTKIEMKIKKVEGVRWSSLETDNESQFSKPITTGTSSSSAAPVSATTTSTSVPASSTDVHKYPSSKHMYADWDKLAKQLQEDEKRENLEGDAALNNLFKQIYSDGSDEVKRAMNKSFQESGGTVLSTNWKDIKKEKVEVKPPDCMEYKEYEY